MTEEEAKRARTVFLAALNESDPLNPIPDDAAFVNLSRDYDLTASPDDWEPRWFTSMIHRSHAEIHRAAVIASASVGYPVACFTCWSMGDDRYLQCIAGNCPHEQVSA